MKLNELKRNETGIVTDIQLDDCTAARLEAIGLRKGTAVTMLRHAPFGGLYEFAVLSARIALRESECRKISVEREMKADDCRACRKPKLRKNNAF